MTSRNPRISVGRLGRLNLAVGVLLLVAQVCSAQYAVRPDDPVGLSIREPRVRIIHSDTAEVPGTSMHLQSTDPWLAYQRGRSYFFREWGLRDGAYRHVPDRPEAASANSCGVCHNTPFPSPGAGGNVGIEVRVGRNAPHFFGGGLLETIGIQIRSQILDRFDANRNGFLDHPAETAGKRVILEMADGVNVDFGSLDDANDDGRPDLNPAIMVRMVHESGSRDLFVNGRPATLKSSGVVGYDLAVGVFASSSGDHQFPSMRSFASGVFVTIFGILPEGPTVPIDPLEFVSGHMLSLWGERTNAGSFLSEIMLTGDPELALQADPPATVTEGEMDLLEWYMINHPAPALGRQTAETERGRQLMRTFECTSCHLEQIDILPADEQKGMPGDRRFFDLAVQYNKQLDRLEGRVRDLTVPVSSDGETKRVRKREGFAVRGAYTDLLHHDLGQRFWEYETGSEGLRIATTAFRTSPLWGVGSTAPYGHDGRSPTLDLVIRRHAGAAEVSKGKYVAASAEDRAAVVAFLKSMVLYQPETLPTDLNGDGTASASFKRDGLDLGPEVFRGELLMKVPPRYEGWTDKETAAPYFSYRLENVREAYRTSLPGLCDQNGNTIPDIQEGAGGGLGCAAVKDESQGRE